MCQCTVFGCGHVHHDTFIKRCNEAQASGFACSRLVEVKLKAPCSECWAAEFDKKMAKKQADLCLGSTSSVDKVKKKKETKAADRKPIHTLKILPAYEPIGGLRFDDQKGHLVNKAGSRMPLPKVFAKLPVPGDFSYRDQAKNFSEEMEEGEILPGIGEAMAQIMKKA